MRFSTKIRYGLRALVDIAIYGKDNPVGISFIAKKENLSVKYLESLVSQLKKAGLVKSIRGNSGGYLLAKPAKNITAYDVIFVLDGPLSLTPCTTKKDVCNLKQECYTTKFWQELSILLINKARSVTLLDLIDDAKEFEKQQEFFNEK